MKVRVFGVPLLMLLAIGALSLSTRRRDDSLCKPFEAGLRQMVARLQSNGHKHRPRGNGASRQRKTVGHREHRCRYCLQIPPFVAGRPRFFRHARFGADTGVLESVHVIRYGTMRYVASNLRPIGEWVNWTVLDTSFTILDGLSQ